MISWNPCPFIFIHIPRCAGTSIEKALIPLTTKATKIGQLSGSDLATHWLPGGGHGRQHAKLTVVGTHVPLGHFFKFTFVRNPWARAVSQIRYLQTGTQDLPFTGKDFQKNLWLYCQKLEMSHGHDLGVCQLDYLVDTRGRMAMDFVGRFENLEKDFKTICQKLGVKQPPKLPHLHASRRARPYQDYYDKKTTDWIRRRFAKDIEYFSYEFDE